jgi:hypothetical protein
LGRHSWSEKGLVEDSGVLDIFWLHRNDYLCGRTYCTLPRGFGGNLGSNVFLEIRVDSWPTPNGWARLYYGLNNPWTGEKAFYDYKINLTATYCHWGGKRWWFECPLEGCGRRVAKLYLPSGRKYFGCRSCHRLTYQTCRESHGSWDRYLRSRGMTPGQFNRIMFRGQS